VQEETQRALDALDRRLREAVTAVRSRQRQARSMSSVVYTSVYCDGEEAGLEIARQLVEALRKAYA
jgi:hypothetical protein